MDVTEHYHAIDQYISCMYLCDQNNLVVALRAPDYKYIMRSFE